MIFVTVGSMLPFNRLVQLFDKWAAANPEEEVFIQIGAGNFEPIHTPWSRMIDRSDFESKIANASLIVAHAGVGSIFAALEHAKPIVVVPRYAAFLEHTTDHQLHTVERFRDKPGIVVCTKSDDLGEKIVEARLLAPLNQSISKTAPRAFVERLRAAILAR